jgi:hypothetical protein
MSWLWGIGCFGWARVLPPRAFTPASVWRQGRFRRQARRNLTIRELMEKPEVAPAGLRVEEVIAAYQYTGPLFQVTLIARVGVRVSMGVFALCVRLRTLDCN